MDPRVGDVPEGVGERRGCAFGHVAVLPAAAVEGLELAFRPPRGRDLLQHYQDVFHVLGREIVGLRRDGVHGVQEGAVDGGGQLVACRVQLSRGLCDNRLVCRRSILLGHAEDFARHVEHGLRVRVPERANRAGAALPGPALVEHLLDAGADFRAPLLLQLHQYLDLHALQRGLCTDTSDLGLEAELPLALQTAVVDGLSGQGLEPGQAVRRALDPLAEPLAEAAHHLLGGLHL